VTWPLASRFCPAAAILPIGSGGKISYFTQSGTNLLADIAGFDLS